MPRTDAIVWFFANLFEPLFTHAQVLALSGDQLKHDTLQNWANRKYVKPKIVGGKRMYSPIEVAQVVLAQPFVSRLEMTPTAATLVVVSALLILNRKMKSKAIVANETRYQLFAYTASYEEPSIFDSRKAAPNVFESASAFFVLPIGRLLDDLALQQQELLETSRAGAA
jgi:hypothetical protein